MGVYCTTATRVHLHVCVCMCVRVVSLSLEIRESFGDVDSDSSQHTAQTDEAARIDLVLVTAPHKLRENPDSKPCEQKCVQGDRGRERDIENARERERRGGASSVRT